MHPIQRFFRLLKLDKKDITYVYLYAIFAGLIALTLPLGVQAIIGLISGGRISSSWALLIAVVTLGTGAAVNSLLFQNPRFSGGYGGAQIPRPRLFGVDLGIDAWHGEASFAFSVGCLVVVALGCLAVSNLRRSRTGQPSEAALALAEGL